MGVRKGPQGPSLRVARVTEEVAQRLVYVRAIYLAVYNDPDVHLEDVAVEFYTAVGAVLEGKPLRQIEFKQIKREKVFAQLKDGE